MPLNGQRIMGQSVNEMKLILIEKSQITVVKTNLASKLICLLVSLGYWNQFVSVLKWLPLYFNLTM
jgi:hypothetical protein